MAFSLIDRFALSLLFEPIKADLGLSDTQLGLLHGVAFGLFYATMGIPIAWLIDRWSRKWVIFWGIACWSVMTALCGLARNFTQLLGARIGVGVGEAALAPAGYSLIGDIVPGRHLTTALSTFQMGALLGGGLASLLGGEILRFTSGLDLEGVPLLEGMAPRQLTFIAVALLGVLFLALLFFIREPVRTGAAVRARVSAVYVFMINMVGLGIGPTMVGLMSDHLFSAVDGVLLSLRIFSLGMCLIALLSLGALQSALKTTERPPPQP